MKSEKNKLIQYNVKNINYSEPNLLPKVKSFLEVSSDSSDEKFNNLIKLVMDFAQDYLNIFIAKQEVEITTNLPRFELKGNLIAVNSVKINGVETSDYAVKGSHFKCNSQGEEVVINATFGFDDTDNKLSGKLQLALIYHVAWLNSSKDIYNHSKAVKMYNVILGGRV